MDIKRILKKLMVPGDKLSQRAFSAGVWGGFSRMGLKMFGIIRNLILARLLAPADFGLFGIILITLSFLDTFTQHGMNEALIQKNVANMNVYMDTAWTVKMLRGFVLSGLLFLLSPVIAHFFNEPAAVKLFHIIALSLIFGGLGNIGMIKFTKDLEFHKRFIYDFCSVLIDLIVSMTLAFIWRNAYALAFGYLAGVASGCVLSYFLHPYRPKFSINIQYARELMQFGKWVWGRTIVQFFLSQGAPTFIGKMYSPALLGLYQMAGTLSKSISQDLPMIIHDVSYPLYSGIQDKLGKLQYVYIKNIKILTFILFPLGVFLYTFTDQIVVVLLGEKWVDTIPLVRIMVFSGVINSVSSPNNAMVVALGRPDILTKRNIMKLIALAGLIYPFSVLWQLQGIALASLLSNIVAIPTLYTVVLKRIQLRVSTILKVSAIILANSLLAVWITTVISNGWKMNGFWLLVIEFSLAAVFYLGLAYLTDLKFNYGLRRALHKDFILNLLDLNKAGA